MSHHINLTRIKGVADALAGLNDEIAFVGGATVSLYADNPAQSDTRPTDDIDVLVEIATYNAYIKLQNRLASLGFALDTESKLTCRYKYQGLTVDIMPIGEDVLGFSNRWYKEGFQKLIRYQTEHNIKIPIFPVAYFVASKLEAFYDRGGGDGRTSKDFEDVIFVLDNRVSVWDDFLIYPTVADYIREAFRQLLKHPNMEEWVFAHVDPGTASLRSRNIIQKMSEIVAQKSEPQ